MSNSFILLAIDQLRDGNSLTTRLAEQILAEVHHMHQWASLAVWLWNRPCNADEKRVLQHAQQFPELKRLWSLPNPDLNAGQPTEHDWFDTLLITTSQRGHIGPEVIQRLIQEFIDGDLEHADMAMWLAMVCRFGLQTEDVQYLTTAMAESGTIHDYRQAPELSGRRLIRRYPTGALSEKSALILPALMTAFHDSHPVASPFMVARSLSFTGGTWDKLLSIPGFQFPHPGQEAINAMASCGCAMVVSKDDSNPADRLMYQLRSATGTVRSIPLAAASIASKQLALPAHRLLLDVRYGNGAFFQEDEARELAHLIQTLVELAGTQCDLVFTDTPQPGGSAIGNALEVIEAITLMTDSPADWNKRSLSHQRNTVLDFFAQLMTAEFPEDSQSTWRQRGEDALADGRVAQAFSRILHAHGVDTTFTDKLLSNPFRICPNWNKRHTITSDRHGTLTAIDQRALGYFVNVELGGGGNAYLGEVDRSTGIRLHKRLGDHIKQDETLMDIVLPGAMDWDESIAQRCREFYTIEERYPRQQN